MSSSSEAKYYLGSVKKQFHEFAVHMPYFYLVAELLPENWTKQAWIQRFQQPAHNQRRLREDYFFCLLLHRFISGKVFTSLVYPMATAHLNACAPNRYRLFEDLLSDEPYLDKMFNGDPFFSHCIHEIPRVVRDDSLVSRPVIDLKTIPVPGVFCRWTMKDGNNGLSIHGNDWLHEHELLFQPGSYAEEEYLVSGRIEQLFMGPTKPCTLCDTPKRKLKDGSFATMCGSGRWGCGRGCGWNSCFYHPSVKAMAVGRTDMTVANGYLLFRTEAEVEEDAKAEAIYMEGRSDNIETQTHNEIAKCDAAKARCARILRNAIEKANSVMTSLTDSSSSSSNSSEGDSHSRKRKSPSPVDHSVQIDLTQ